MRLGGRVLEFVMSVCDGIAESATSTCCSSGNCEDGHDHGDIVYLLCLGSSDHIDDREDELENICCRDKPTERSQSFLKRFICYSGYHSFYDYLV